MNFPEDLKYTREHEWARVNGTRIVGGITEFAQDQLGDIVYVELPSVSDEVKKGEAFGVVESTKAVSDLFAPVSGKVVEVNDPLFDAPETINDDPYEVSAGPNGAIVHYRAVERTNRAIVPDMLYLVDSGVQSRDGTTDITRTIAIGTPTEEMRTRFTLVLKGHIALARGFFPQGTRGSQLDVLARRALWKAGLDYAHGTGHGVGSFLSV